MQRRLPAPRRELRPRAAARRCRCPAYLPVRDVPRPRRGRRSSRSKSAEASLLADHRSARTTRYHDEEWGRPVTRRARHLRAALPRGLPVGAFVADDPAQAGGFRERLRRLRSRCGRRVSASRDVERLLGDAGIVRHRGKIEATIANARATRRAARVGQPLDELVWRMRRDATRPVAKDWFAQTPESVELVEAAARGRLPLRRADDRLRRDAGMRGRQRPPRRLLGARGSRKGAVALMLDERVRAVLAPARGGGRGRARAPACRRAQRSRQVARRRASSSSPSSRRRPTARCSRSAARAATRRSGSRAGVRASRRPRALARARPGASSRPGGATSPTPGSRSGPSSSRATRSRRSREIDDVVRRRLPRRREGRLRAAVRARRARSSSPARVVVADNVLSHVDALAAYSAARQADPTLSSVTVPLDRGLEISVVLR